MPKFPSGYNPKGIGERSEAQIIASFLKHGFVVLTPFGDNQRYDLVVQEGEKFIRVQCKTARMSKFLKGRAFAFNACSTNWYQKSKRSYKGDADVFAVYLRETDEVFVVPVEDANNSECVLRLNEGNAKNTPRNKKFRMAKDYLFDPNRSLLDYPKRAYPNGRGSAF